MSGVLGQRAGRRRHLRVGVAVTMSARKVPAGGVDPVQQHDRTARPAAGSGRAARARCHQGASPARRRVPAKPRVTLRASPRARGPAIAIVAASTSVATIISPTGCKRWTATEANSPPASAPRLAPTMITGNSRCPLFRLKRVGSKRPELGDHHRAEDADPDEERERRRDAEVRGSREAQHVQREE